MIDRSDFGLLWEALDRLVPFLPPFIGALIGTRYVQPQDAGTRAARRTVLVAFLTSFAIACYAGPAAAEWLSLGPRTAAGVAVLIAVFGTDLLGGLLTTVRQWRVDPIGTFRGWRDALLGRTPS